MTTLEKLTERVRELVPELMKLSFGCEVQSKRKGQKERVVSEYCGRFTTPSMFAGCSKEDIEDGYEILGHPITLEHCRVALVRVGGLEDWFKTDTELCNQWKNLEPWEEQAEVHTFLEQYLLTTGE